MAGELSWLRHPSEIYGKVPKRKYLDAFPRRFSRHLARYIVYCLVVGKLPRLLSEIRYVLERYPVDRVYLDYHLYNKCSIRGVLAGRTVVPENKGRLKRDKEGRAALAVFYMLDAFMAIYKGKEKGKRMYIDPSPLSPKRRTSPSLERGSSTIY